MTKNIDVIKAFVNGESKPHTKNLKIIGDTLVNYNTCLVQRIPQANGGFVFLNNTTKYSVSTSKIQSYIRSYLYGKVVEVSNVRMGARELEGYKNKAG